MCQCNTEIWKIFEGFLHEALPPLWGGVFHRNPEGFWEPGVLCLALDPDESVKAPTFLEDPAAPFETLVSRYVP